VRAYTVAVDTIDGLMTSTVNGTSIGNKKIDLLSAPVEKVNKLVFTATESIATPVISHFGIYYCPS
jgi:hypothetical protein